MVGRAQNFKLICIRHFPGTTKEKLKQYCWDTKAAVAFAFF